METKASVTDQTIDQTVEKHVEEMKVDGDIKHDDESVSHPKDLEGTGKEAENSANMDASASEQEEKPEDKMSERTDEKVKKDEADEELASEVLEKESESEAVEKPEENSEAFLGQESESEAAKEPAVSEMVTEEIKPEELPELAPAPVSETEDKATESLPVSTIAETELDTTESLDARESAQISQDEKILAQEVGVNPEPSKEEPSSNETSFPELVPAEVNEPNDAGAIIPEVPDVEVLKSTEVEEKVERSVEGEEPTLGETTKTDDLTEVSSEGGGEDKTEKGESLEDDTAILAEASKDLDASTEVPEVSTEGENASVGVEVVEEKDRSLDVDSTSKEPVIDSKEAESEPKPTEGKQEVPAKPRQSNNIMSKVKHSIAKVKKAIIGKSPSSKTMSSQSNNDVNV